MHLVFNKNIFPISFSIIQQIKVADLTSMKSAANEVFGNRQEIFIFKSGL